MNKTNPSGVWRNWNSQSEKPGNLKFCAPLNAWSLTGQTNYRYPKKSEKERIKGGVKSVLIGYSNKAIRIQF